MGWGVSLHWGCSRTEKCRLWESRGNLWEITAGRQDGGWTGTGCGLCRPGRRKGGQFWVPSGFLSPCSLWIEAWAHALPPPASPHMELKPQHTGSSHPPRADNHTVPTSAFSGSRADKIRLISLWDHLRQPVPVSGEHFPQ